MCRRCRAEHEDHQHRDVHRGRRLPALDLREGRDGRGRYGLRGVQRRQGSGGRRWHNREPGPGAHRAGPQGVRDAVLGHASPRPAEPRRDSRQGHRRHRLRAHRHQGQGPGDIGRRALRRAHQGQDEALLVALRHYPGHVVGPRGYAPTAVHAGHRRPGPGGGQTGLHGPEDQHRDARRPGGGLLRRLRRRAGHDRPVRDQAAAPPHRGADRHLPRRRRPRRGHQPRPELQLQA